jgi:1-acyl-sn-glycerol-3-phosphate acyltransferase
MRRAIGRGLLRLLGWRAVGAFPAGCERCVMLAAPHTSNWDLPLMLAFAMAFELRVAWMGKDSLFQGLFGRLMYAVGGIPVRRGARENLVEQMAARFHERPYLLLLIAPEGTRARAPHWKSGFYWIARRAQVPIVPAFLDYETRTAGFGPPLVPSDSLRADMDALRDVYAGKRGLYRDGFGPVRLLEETEATSAA